MSDVSGLEDGRGKMREMKLDLTSPTLIWIRFGATRA